MTDDRMALAEVLRVLDAIDGVGCRWWVGGGWGVDALVSRQTRTHRDLDLAFDAEREERVVAALGVLGYTIETDWRPVRFEMAAPGARRVDLHPVVLDANDDGVQAGLDGAVFRYPASVRVAGRLGGREVTCLSVDSQLELHRGYEPRAVDRADIAVLEALAQEVRADEGAAEF